MSLASENCGIVLFISLFIASRTLIQQLLMTTSHGVDLRNLALVLIMSCSTSSFEFEHAMQILSTLSDSVASWYEELISLRCTFFSKLIIALSRADIDYFFWAALNENFAKDISTFVTF